MNSRQAWIGLRACTRSLLRRGGSDASSTPAAGLVSRRSMAATSASASPVLEELPQVPTARDEIDGFLARRRYEPPAWASHLSPIPSHAYNLAHLPTPIHKWNLPNLPRGTEVWIKRDDLTGLQLSGNKVGKLEFLLADAVGHGADCVITIGAIQSNHCRTTAVAAKYLDLDAYLILRTPEGLPVNQDPGTAGNLLVERMVGAHVELASREQFAEIGGEGLANLLKERLVNEGRKPYVIPFGGSNPLSTWGSIETIREIERQVQKTPGDVYFDDIAVALGSGATTAGLSLGSWLGELKAKVHAFSVCDTPNDFYDFVQDLLDGLQAGLSSRDIVDIKCAKGLGYALSTPDELKFIKEIAEATGVILDPVYSGKAAYTMMKDMSENPAIWRGRKVLFIHTGGLLGLYGQAEEMAPMLNSCRPMVIDASLPRMVRTGKIMF